jgi:hypothetical protein
MGFNIVRPIGAEVTEGKLYSILENIEAETVFASGSISSSGNISTTGNINSGGNISTTGNINSGGNISTTGNIVGSDLTINLDRARPRFVTVYNRESLVSSDGVTWTRYLSPHQLSVSSYSMIYANGLFLSVGGFQSGVAISQDGVSWTQTYRSPNTGPQFDSRSVAYGNGTFVVVGQTTTGSGISTYATSTNGITWTNRTTITSRAWNSIAYGNGLFVAVSGGYIATSSDGITWSESTRSGEWQNVSFLNNLFLAVASNNIIITSPDGITWTERSTPVSARWKSSTYGDGKFVVVPSGDNFSTFSTNIAITSPDGITWTQRTLPTAASWRSVTHGNGLFVAMARSSDFYATSPDGITWTQRSMPASNLAKENQVVYAEPSLLLPDSIKGVLEEIVGSV